MTTTNPTNTIADLDQTVKRLKEQKGVKGVIVSSLEGVVLRSSMEMEETVKYLPPLIEFCKTASSLVKNLDKEDDLSFIRIHTRKFEYLISPDASYLMFVVHDHTTERR